MALFLLFSFFGGVLEGGDAVGGSGRSRAGAVMRSGVSALGYFLLR